jgi:hypothetical protein
MAARIAAKARAGEILVSAVFKAVTESAGDLQFDQGYDVELKGLSGSYHVHRVLWSDEARAAAVPIEEPARTTATTAARRTSESEERRRRPRQRNRRPLIGIAIAAFVIFRVFFAQHEKREHRKTVATETAAQSAPIQAAPDQSAAAPPLMETRPPANAAQQVAINAPGLSTQEREKALKTVSNWLNLYDQGHFRRAWDQSTFSIPKEDWVQNQERVHARRGMPISRTLESEAISPGPINPNRMEFRYQTQFEKGKPMVETIWTIPRPNGEWIVVGYGAKMEAETNASP